MSPRDPKTQLVRTPATTTNAMMEERAMLMRKGREITRLGKLAGKIPMVYGGMELRCA